MPTSLPIHSDDAPSFVSELLYRLKVRDVMTRDLVSVRPDQTLRQIQALMKSNAITGVPVADGRRLLGIVSMDDIIKAFDEGGMDQSAEQRMTRNCIVLEDDMPLSFGIGYMEKFRFGRFPVLSKTGELVGIITSRDIIVSLLLAMNKEIEHMETQLRRPEPAAKEGADTTITREFAIRSIDFENAGRASSEIKKLCKDAGLDPKFIRRVAIASYELEMNQVIHSLGGTLRFSLDGKAATVEACDIGPGIADVEQALSEGYSTANEWVRSLGFGAGMGLPNAKRVSDAFKIESSEKGTRVVCAFFRTDAEGSKQDESL